MCLNLTNPENGQVVEAVDGNVTGTVANFSCDADYILVGSLVPRASADHFQYHARGYRKRSELGLVGSGNETN